MLLLSIGTKERGLEFCERTGFDSSRLLADPESNSYAPLGMKKGVKETFFSKETPNAIWEDMKTGRIETLKGVMKVWIKQKLWIPPQQDQAFQQGGVVIFDGEKVVWVWRDPATGAHADLKEVVRVATALASVKSS
ncbi:hypothetical protein Ndes2526B_g06754 [Nannochloris sp. 'desiccata']|nr:hypothetical protein KSW81_005139 [Chlorella desiccata (nom. nud.)]KAH7617864.1 hypothetical protein NADE_000068 [Chlorella desiccata (nom. nud.)]